MKNLLTFMVVVLFTFAFWGCSTKVSKGVAINQFNQEEFIRNAIDTHPQLLYCFSEDRQYLMNSLKKLLVQCVDVTMEKMPELMTKSEIHATGIEIGLCLASKFLIRHKDTFSIEGLDSSQATKCNQLKEAIKKASESQWN